jgi:hypothetical protein
LELEVQLSQPLPSPSPASQLVGYLTLPSTICS